MAATDFASAGRVVTIVRPDAVAATSPLTSLEIDTKGWRWMHISVHTGTVAATTNMTVNVQSATTSGGSFSNISGASFTVATTDDDTVKHGLIDLEQQSRYIQVAGTTGATSTTDICIVAVLYGCANTAEYIASGAGGADELEFTVLT